MFKSFSMELAGRTLTVDVDRVAKQANGAALMHYGDTVVLSTCTASEKPREGIDFFPLSVEYEEKQYAVGKIPGGFNKREGKASENAVLTSRVIDRPMRPLFPKDYRNDVTLNNLVMSVDPTCSPELTAMLGSAIATAISDVPFDGPCATTQVGLVDGEFVINPSNAEMANSALKLTVASTKEKVIMIEAGADEIPEAKMIEAIYKAHEVNQEIKLKNLILKEFKPDEKKKIKEYIKSVTLKYMINDEEIPSVEDEKYNFKVIQYFDFEITDIKKAGFLANLYQESIKSPCILRFYDNSKELYSLALKRLNQNDRNEIVVTDTVMTETFDLSMSGSAKREVERVLDYSKILNRTNKVNFYSEIFIKNYILKNQKYYQKSGNILESLIWYDRNKTINIFENFKNLVMYKEKIKSTIRNSEKVEINKKIREIISELDKY